MKLYRVDGKGTALQAHQTNAMCHRLKPINQTVV